MPYQPDLFGKAHHSLLLLWGEPDSGEDFTVRLVRPLEPGKYRKPGRADMDIDLPRSKTDFMALKFEVYDEEYEEPTFGIAEEEAVLNQLNQLHKSIPTGIHHRARGIVRDP